ncbi:MAG: hypothetical protein FWG87_00115 [Defluviitaleaceae bacterium]|nr:hypothetical protein [Defluviitaleaceae bacterium]
MERGFFKGNGTRISADLADLRGFCLARFFIRVIRVNPLNPCLIPFKNLRYPRSFSFE